MRINEGINFANLQNDQTHKTEIDNQINAYLDSVLEVIKTP